MLWIASAVALAVARTEKKRSRAAPPQIGREDRRSWAPQVVTRITLQSSLGGEVVVSRTRRSTLADWSDRIIGDMPGYVVKKHTQTDDQLRRTTNIWSVLNASQRHHDY